MMLHAGDKKSEIEDKDPGQPSDEIIALFILGNLHDEGAIEDYLNSLKKPLSAAILTLKIDLPDGTVYNLLGYAAEVDARFFDALVRSASPQALDAALMEAPYNDQTPRSLHAILHCQEPSMASGRIELIHKASVSVLSALVVSESFGVPLLEVALGLGDPLVAIELLKKASAKSINKATDMLYHDEFFNSFIVRLWLFMGERVGKGRMIEALLAKLSNDTLNRIILMPYIGGDNMVAYLLKHRTSPMEPSLDPLLALLITHMQKRTLEGILRKDFLKKSLSLFHLLLITERSPEVVALLLLRTNQKLLDAFIFADPSSAILFLLDLFNPKTKAAFLTAEAIIQNLSRDTLRTLVNGLSQTSAIASFKKMQQITDHSLVWGDGSTFRSSFLKYISLKNSTLFNLFIAKVISDADRIDLPMRALYQLDGVNLGLYLAKHPELSREALMQTRIGRSQLNWLHDPRFLAKLTKASSVLQQQIDFSLAVYRYLKHDHLIEALALLVLGYLELEEGTVAERIRYEITKDRYAAYIPFAKELYRHLTMYFRHARGFRYLYEEARVILEYALDDPRLAFIAATEVEKDREEQMAKLIMVAEPFESQEVFADKKAVVTCNRLLTRTLSFFNPLDTKPVPDMKSRQASGSHASDVSLIEKIAQAWVDYKGVSLLSAAQKTVSAERLQAEAKVFGLECKDMQRDGNCFFHAIADQLAAQGLATGEVDHEVLRANAVDYIIHHLDEYKPYLAEHDGDVNDFVDKNSLGGTWADHLIISALSRSLEMTIAIVRNDGAPPTIIKQRGAMATLYVGQEVGLHYQSLLANPALVPTRSLQVYIDAAAFDHEPDAVPEAKRQGP